MKVTEINSLCSMLDEYKQLKLFESQTKFTYEEYLNFIGICNPEFPEKPNLPELKVHELSEIYKVKKIRLSKKFLPFVISGGIVAFGGASLALNTIMYSSGTSVLNYALPIIGGALFLCGLAILLVGLIILRKDKNKIKNREIPEEEKYAISKIEVMNKNERLKFEEAKAANEKEYEEKVEIVQKQRKEYALAYPIKGDDYKQFLKDSAKQKDDLDIKLDNDLKNFFGNRYFDRGDLEEFVLIVKAFHPNNIDDAIDIFREQRLRIKEMMEEEEMKKLQHARDLELEEIRYRNDLRIESERASNQAKEIEKTARLQKEISDATARTIANAQYDSEIASLEAKLKIAQRKWERNEKGAFYEVNALKDSIRDLESRRR